MSVANICENLLCDNSIFVTMLAVWKLKCCDYQVVKNFDDMFIHSDTNQFLKYRQTEWPYYVLFHVLNFSLFCFYISNC